MSSLGHNVYMFFHWDQQIDLLLSMTETKLNSSQNITREELETLTGRMKNISQYILRMERKYLPEARKSIQLLAMDGHFLEVDATLAQIELQQEPVLPTAQFRKALLDKMFKEMIDLPKQRERLGKLMLQIESKPVRSAWSLPFFTPRIQRSHSPSTTRVQYSYPEIE